MHLDESVNSITDTAGHAREDYKEALSSPLGLVLSLAAGSNPPKQKNKT